MIRFFDIVFSVLGLFILFPVMLSIYILIVLDSTGTGFFKQERIGKNGKVFNLIKFRTMSNSTTNKSLITIGGRDPRITKIGYYLRKYKLDELPQFLNVLKGDMSFVGPRPEVKKYVDLYSLDQQKVLSIRPGITDYASIEYVDENILLGKSDDPENTYINEIMPHKLELNMKYINNYNLGEYFNIILKTILKILN